MREADASFGRPDDRHAPDAPDHDRADRANRTPPHRRADEGDPARDLCDSVAQALFAVNVTADALPGLWELDPDEGRAALADLGRLTRCALADMRALLVELQPGALTCWPLDRLLLTLTASAATRARVHARLAPAPALPPDVQAALYRLTQQALDNAIKHCAATSAEIRLEVDPPAAGPGPWRGAVRLAISYDGRGLDPARRPSERLGLASMRRRAAAAGVALRVRSRPGRGTTVEIGWKGPADALRPARCDSGPRPGEPDGG